MAPRDQSLRFKMLTAVWWRSTALECYATHKTTIFIRSPTQSSSPIQHTHIFFTGYYHLDAQHCTWRHHAPLYCQQHLTEPQSVASQMTQIFINITLGTSDLVCLKHLAVLIYIWFNGRKISNVQNFLPGKVQIFLFSTQPPCLKSFFTQKVIQSRTHTFCSKEPSYWSHYGKSFIFVWRFAGLHSHTYCKTFSFTPPTFSSFNYLL